jgi:hypothetical protein
MKKIHNNNLSMLINKLKESWNKVNKDNLKVIKPLMMIKWVKVPAFPSFLWTQKDNMGKFQELGGDKFDKFD